VTGLGGGSSALLSAAGSVLRENGFDVGTELLEGTDSGWLLAESELFVVGVAAATDLERLREVEAFAAPQLIQRLSPEHGVQGKRWDAYLVLMATRSADEPNDARKLIEIEYDTRGLRRLVAVAVEPTSGDIRRVLRPFIPLPEPAPDGLTDAYADLRDQLVVNGVEDDEATRLVAFFKDWRHLDDV
jgi:hypothetical protein